MVFTGVSTVVPNDLSMYLSISKSLLYLIRNEIVFTVCRSSLAGKKKKADGKNKSKRKKEEDTTNSQ